jgi:hypothetical protein
MSMFARRLSFAWLFAIGALTAASPSFAQGDAKPSDTRPNGTKPNDGNLEQAKQLFEAGRKAMSESRFDEACQSFEQSLALARGIGTRFNLADCEQRRGHLTRARELFLEVAELARDVGQSEREGVARERAAAVDAELPQLKLEFEGAQPTVTIDGRELAAERAREAIALDLGTHQVSASATGKRSFSKEVALTKPGMFLVLSVPALSDEKAESSNSESGAASSGEELATPPASADRPPRERGSGARRAALVLGGIGVGAAVAGAAFGIQFLSNNHDAKAVCPTSYGCTSDDIARHRDFIDDARRARTLSYVGFGVGAAALVGAGLLYFTAGNNGSVTAMTGFNVDGSWNLAVRARY